MKTSKKAFTIRTTKGRWEKKNDKRVFVKEPLTLVVELVVESTLIDLGYGYKSWYTKVREGWDSALRGMVLDRHHSIWPKEGDVWEYKNRKFVVGPISGFVVYHAPLLENGKEVAKIRFEDYYKD